MEEKTAKIPSLKEFKETRKEKDAQRERSQSMQTKREMERNAQRHSHDNGRTPQESGRRKSEGNVNRTSRPPQPKRPPRQQAKVNSQNAQRENPQRRREAESRTYVRDRLNEEKTQKRPPSPPRESYHRESEPLRQYRSQRGTPQRGERVPQNLNRRPPQSRGAVKNTKPPQKQRKPKKPLSPKARKLRNILIYAGIILGVLLIALVLSLTVLFKTEQIVVSGNEMYSSEEIIEASGLNIGENIFTANKAAAAERIEKTYPYVEEANVYFTIPDSINIEIKMASPSYMVESSSGFYIVSEKGKVLEVSATDDEAAVPVIEGVAVSPKSPGEHLEYGSDTVTKALQEIFSAFKSLGCKDITAVNVETKDDTVKLRYVYDDRIVVYLGNPDHIYHKIHTANTIIKEKLDVDGSKPVGELDVSRSFETKKSYFNEYSILADNVAPPNTTAPEETTEAEEAVNYDSYYL